MLFPEKIKIFLFSNSLFLLYALHYFLRIDIFLMSLLINTMIFILPGLGWIWLFRKRGIEDKIVLLVYCILFSTIVLIMGIFCQWILKLQPSSLFLFLFIFVVTNFGILFAKNDFFFIQKILKKHISLSILGFLVIYAILFWGAYKVIPPLEDNDLDLQATSYGIMKTFTPFTLTDRLILYDFSHPILINFYSAASILFSEKLPEVKFYYDYGLKVKLALKEKAIHSPLTWVGKKNKQLKRWITRLEEDMYKEFNRNPNLIYTRMPHIFLGSLGAIVFFLFLNFITRSKILSFLGGMIYITLPENFVALCADVYTSLTNLFIILILYFYIVKPDKSLKESSTIWIMFWLNFFMALAYNKAIILPLSMLFYAYFFRKEFKERKMENTAIVGFFSGTFLSWLYGAGVNFETFILDYFRYHFLNRFLYIKDNFGEGYTFIELWKGFVNNHGIVFSLISLFSIIYLLRIGYKSRYNLLAIWFFMGAVIFSIVDCKQTYHLLLIIPPLLLGIVIFLQRLDKITKTRLAAISILGAILLRNIYVIYKLTYNFYYISTFKEW